MSDRSSWIWMPHPGHLIVASNCKFFMNTCVGDFLVSTVGEYLPIEPLREFEAQIRGVSLKGKGEARLVDYMQKIGYQEIGADRLYETMVFLAEPAPGGANEGCCLYRMADARELDFAGYNNPRDAYEGHLVMCEKWSQKTVADVTDDPNIVE